MFSYRIYLKSCHWIGWKTFACYTSSGFAQDATSWRATAQDKTFSKISAAFLFQRFSKSRKANYSPQLVNRFTAGAESVGWQVRLSRMFLVRCPEVDYHSGAPKMGGGGGWQPLCPHGDIAQRCLHREELILLCRRRPELLRVWPRRANNQENEIAENMWGAVGKPPWGWFCWVGAQCYNRIPNVAFP